jgi:hypothetical protein
MGVCNDVGTGNYEEYFYCWPEVYQRLALESVFKCGWKYQTVVVLFAYFRSERQSEIQERRLSLRLAEIMVIIIDLFLALTNLRVY